MKKTVLTIALFALLTSLLSCKDDEPDTGKISIIFNENVDDQSLVLDSMAYTNAAGNQYLVTEVQYLISNVALYYDDGTIYPVKQDDGIHYRDRDIEETSTWIINDDVPSGVIDSLVFTFGLDEETNKTGLFPNPPESNMLWPDELGGGYHYMKLNGKWLDVNNFLSPFNFHLGIGQTYDTTGAITSFVQNYFSVSASLPLTSSYVIIVNKGRTTDINLTMNINSWFTSPDTLDFNVIGGMMMQNEDAMKAACENGKDAFSIGALYAK
jgi:hypothetical protein